MVRAATRHPDRIGAGAEVVAAMGVGASIYAAHEALRSGQPLEEAARLAVAYVYAANRGIADTL